MKGTEDKFRPLSSQVSMTYSGEPGDTVQFAEYIQRNVRLYAMRNEMELAPSAAAHFTRRALADSLRTKVF
jgi:20S proteasome subunit beta 4